MRYKPTRYTYGIAHCDADKLGESIQLNGPLTSTAGTSSVQITDSNTTITTDALQTNAGATHTGSLTVTADKSGESIQLSGPLTSTVGNSSIQITFNTTITTDALQTNAAATHTGSRSP